jgi:hypothetical protein
MLHADKLMFQNKMGDSGLKLGHNWRQIHPLESIMRGNIRLIIF